MESNPIPDVKTRQIQGEREVRLVFLTLAIIAIGVLFLAMIGRYALEGRHPFQFFADSTTYMDIYNGYLPPPEGSVGISYNFLGPMIILSVTGGNIYLVMALNVIMFIASMALISRCLNLDPVKASIIQLINPMTLSSLMSVNKEIISFPVIAFLLAGYKNKSPVYVAIALALSIFARWQLTAFCVILVATYFVRKMNRYVLVAAILMSISMIYYFAQDFLRPVFENVEISTSSYTEGSGLFERLIDLQNDGWYFAVAPIKAAHLLFSLGTHFSGMLNPLLVYNDQIVAGYCLFNIAIFIVLLLKRQYKLSNDIVMISLIYLIVFALTPVYAPRYFYPVTILWTLIIAGTRGGILDTNNQQYSTVLHA